MFPAGGIGGRFDSWNARLSLNFREGGETIAPHDATCES